jgi:hypothetical protein
VSSLVDTNVLIDVARAHPVWRTWSLTELERAASRGEIYINSIVYAEVSVPFPTPASVDAFIGELGIVLIEMPREALYVAAKAYQVYRQRGGSRTGVLPDFFIGAHAAVMDWPLLTRDPARYRLYFPTVELIAP